MALGRASVAERKPVGRRGAREEEGLVGARQVVPGPARDEVLVFGRADLLAEFTATGPVPVGGRGRSGPGTTKTSVSESETSTIATESWTYSFFATREVLSTLRY